MTRILTVTTIIAVFALSACTKKDDDKKKTPKKSAPTKTTPTPDKKPAAVTPTKAAALAGVFGAYETIRALLADDKADVSAHATTLAAAARKATVPSSGTKHLADLATAADELAKAPSSDIAAVRKIYGEVSRAAVALLGALPEEAKAYHVFQCPMAKGYKRWVQSDKELKNPYMGKKMLACGSEVTTAAK